MEVRDQSDKPFPGVQLTFAVGSGGGTLSATSVTTNSNGRAQSTLTLGPNLGTNTVTVSVTGIPVKQTFNAEGIRTAKKLVIISGDGQQGPPGAALTKPFVVEVRDQSDKPLAGFQVTFSVTAGGGTLSATSVTTDSNGRVESTLTLGPNPGANIITVSVTGSQNSDTFNAEGIRIPDTVEIISGGDQEGPHGVTLENPFIVEVRDQSGESLPGVQVTFSVTAGGGTLSATSVTTDSNGRAESTLTLGPNPGANTVTVSVSGIQENQTFTAQGIRIPTTLEIISGNNQEGLPGSALANPFVAEVREQSDKPFAGVQVTFSVSSGGGTLSATSVTTNSNGRAESILTLGANPGANTVTVYVSGIQEKQTFTAQGIRIPEILEIISGNDQEGPYGETLENPFIVEVRDQPGEPLPGVQVTFSVTAGGGTLSATSVTTDSDGRAASILTLGPDPGANTVTVSVSGIQENQTFTAQGIRTPLAFWIISGFDQKGFIGEALPRPIVVYVADRSGEPLPGAEVTFTVTGGGGTLSVTSAMTDNDGRAESILTLGPDPGTNTVEVAVSRIQERQTAKAIGELPSIPKVDIPDANLRAAIEKALGIASGGTITAGQMATLTELHAGSSDISDLTGLEYAANLSHLGLSRNNISDISALAGLTNVTYLTLIGNNIEDLSPLVANTGLGEGDRINVNRNPLNAASIDTHIPALRSRGVEVFADNLITAPEVPSQVVDIPDPNLRAAIEQALGIASGGTITVEQMATLTELHAGSSDISDLTGLEFATNLTWLNLQINTISDITAVEGLTNLTTLQFSVNAITDITAVVGLTNLATLELGTNRHHRHLGSDWIDQSERSGYWPQQHHRHLPGDRS